MTMFESTARRRELGVDLRDIRLRAELSATELAARLCWTQTMLSRIETGKRTATPMEVAKYTTACGVTGPEQDELIALAEEPDDYHAKPHNGGMPDDLKALILHESTASKIASYQPIYIPGIAQTEEYARAVFTAAGIIAPDDIEARVQNRRSRLDIVTGARPAECMFYVHENALRAPVGGPQVMSEQMLYLLFMDSYSRCSIRVVPAAAGAPGMAAGSFQIFEYGEGKPLVCVQHEATSEFLETEQELECHRDVLRRVASVALDEARSRDFITWVASDFERQGAAEHDDGTGVAQEQP